MKIVDVLEYPIYGEELSKIEVRQSKQVINTINSYSYVVAKKDPEFKRALIEADILLPDGFPIVLGARLLKHIKIKKIAGEDVFRHLMDIANKNSCRVFFLGASNNTLDRIEKKVCLEYPNASVASFSPPFKGVFSEEDNNDMIQAVTAFKPDILFIGMTAPKQEKWVLNHSSRLDVSVICSIGAVFDFYAETVSRPSRFWIQANLEWFVRFIHEPTRLFKRYFVYSPRFAFDLVLAWFQK